MNRPHLLGGHFVARYPLACRMAKLAAGGILLVVLAAGVQNLSWYWSNRMWPAMSSAVAFAESVPAHPFELHLKVKPEDYQKLAAEREKAMAFGKHVADADSYVPAQIIEPNRKLNARIRLKGGGLDHLSGDKWSLRINLKGDNTIRGMDFFSIQDPVRSGFVYEWVLHEMARYCGLVAPRYDFIDVSINGAPAGIYALEESFSKLMLEAHQRREGPIVRFAEQNLFVKDGPVHQKEVLFAADVDAFQTSRTQDNPVLQREFEAARDLLEGFRDQRLTVKQAFDVQKTATCFALIDLCAAGHAVRWKNMRFYYNPVTSLLEPIAYNAYTARSARGAQVNVIGSLLGQRRYTQYFVDEWLDAFFADDEFFTAYVAALERLSDPSFLQRFFAKANDSLQEKLRIIHRDDPDFTFSPDSYLANARVIRNALHPKLPIQVRFDANQVGGGTRTLAVGNTSWLPVELVGVHDDLRDTFYPFHAGTRLPPKRDDVLTYTSVVLPEATDRAMDRFETDRWRLAYRVFGVAEAHAALIVADDATPAQNLAQLASEQANQFMQHPAIAVDEPNRTIVIRPGKWSIDESLFIPAGYLLKAQPGATLNLTNGASLISYSPLCWEGSEESPVVVRSADGSGGGIAVIADGERSTLRHVEFQNLTAPAVEKWQLTGAVTLYQSPVDVTDCQFTSGTGDDQLNVIRTEFKIRRCTFTDSQFDALDADFCRGEIRDSSFTGIGNDAIDLSGGRVLVQACRIDQCKDKAISAGESSEVTINDLTVSNSAFGIVSKDLSTVTGSGIDIHDSRVGIAAYQKKPEFGPASVTIANLRATRLTEDTLIEKGSWAHLNEKQIPGVKLNVAQRIYDE